MDLVLGEKMIRRQTVNSGFSLVELLVALTFMSIIATSIVPFMVRSSANNMTSHETSNVSNLARNTLERYFQADFNDPIVTLTSGTEFVVNEYLSKADERWKPLPIVPGDAKYTRDITVRQYGISAIDDGVLDPGEALDATAPPEQVALKQIEVYVESVSAMRAGFGPNRNVTLTLVKSQ
jgi:prepilin-type N-terminal cleavage/methylation domain-containing protein